MSSSTSRGDTTRNGMALPIALAAIVIVGALVAGVFFASVQEYRVGRNSLANQRATHAAEVGLSTVLSSWNSARTTATRVGKSARMADTTIDGVKVRRQYTRVSPTTFWVTTTATQGGVAFEGRSVKRLNAIVRIEAPDFKIMGAITARGKADVSGNVKISGNDSVVAGWDCPPGGTPGSGLVLSDSAVNYMPGGMSYSVVGNPPVKDSTNMVKNDSTFTYFGGFSYDSLAKLASKVRTAGGTFGTISPQWLDAGKTICDVAHADNWGDTSLVDASTACDSYVPIVHLQGAGNTYLLNGNGGGSGILLVDGNLQIAGTFTWKGLILVKGFFEIAGVGGGGKDGAKVIGAVAAMNKDNQTNRFSGTSNVTFSRCIVNQISSKISFAAPMKNRSWADLSF